MKTSSPIEQIVHMDSLMIPLRHHRLHMKRIYQNQNGPVAFALHGSMENGRIFYNEKGRGLAPYLAKVGFDVFVPDLSGRGGSIPKIAKGFETDQHHAIVEELPALLQEVQTLRPNWPIHFIGHSWGGVLLLSLLGRFPGLPVSSQVYFGSKRSLLVRNMERFFKVDLFWNRLFKWYSQRKGYFPVRQLGIGADDEPLQYYLQVVEWVRKSPWWDPVDGFDYQKGLKAQKVAPTLYLAGKSDKVLGHPEDVRRLMEEVGGEQDKFVLLSKANGNLKDYGHVDMLTARECLEDHFPMVVEWLKKWEQKSEQM
ncbi:alpha/beta fold hydrolase [Persicobacter diffluens]|uniref:Alpha/beta hydrolase n=1 Tax=Persicobacter diffluens TaxID=981 RepID=A0AAN4VWW4_9BACT|nr:alpha/beta hydrolase [Persicobacter diffluens]